MAEEPIFRDRREAGRELAQRLQKYAGRHDLLVLGIPRGGVVVATEVASALTAPLDIFVSRKLGVPGQEELAFGAVASGGTLILDEEIVNAVGISESEIERIAARETQELERREQVFRAGWPPLDVEKKIVVLVDDGIATGASIRVAIAALRHRRPAEIVVAAPVVALSTYERLRREADDVICVHAPKSFYAIGEFYDDFSQVTDEEVIELLRQASSKDHKDPRAAPPRKVDGEART
jgi:putative phosphoribosyl transferase